MYWLAACPLPSLTAPLQVGGADLQECCFQYYTHRSREGPRPRVLEIVRIREMASLQQLLCTLAPAGTPPTHLHIAASQLDVLAPALQGCSALAGLSSLMLSGFTSGRAALDTLLPQALQLKELDLRRSCQEGLPPSLTSRQGLTRLTLHGNGLQDLPPGPYVASELAARPVIVWACVGQQAGWQLWPGRGVHTAAGMRPSWQLNDCLLPLAYCVNADLERLDLRDTRLAVLPPALAAATSLRSLSLEGGCELALTEQAVHTTLLCLPHLHTLSMDVRRTPTQVLRLLRRRLPGLQMQEL